MKKVMTLSLAVILLVGTCVFIGLSTVKSDGYYDYGDDDEAAAEYYATYNFEDDYTTEAQTKYYPSSTYQSQTRQASYSATTEYQAPTKARINHVALQGAVIVEQDGTSSFTYCRKCEACGYVESNMKRNTGGSYGKLVTSFYCPKCKNNQTIEIEHSKY